jgi:hypothetical protein
MIVLTMDRQVGYVKQLKGTVSECVYYSKENYTVFPLLSEV